VSRQILIVNDIHASRRPPSSCTDSYWPDLLDLLLQTVSVAAEREVSAVVWAGDVFHHKTPRLTDHGLVQDLIGVIHAYRSPLFVVPGNHDMQHDRPDSIDVTQPLGVLFRAGARRLDGWAGDNLPLYGVPWQQEWSRERVKSCLAGWESGMFGRSLVVTHAPIYPPGREPRYAGAELTPARWWSDAMADGSLSHGLAYGHIHEPHDTWSHGGTAFCNFGALSRGSLDEYNLEREVGCAAWDEGSGTFEFVPLKSRPAGEVFRLRRHEEVVTAQRSLDDFLAGIQSVTLGALSVEAVIEHIRAAGTDPDVVALAEELLMLQEGAR
jgi:DNA repair exonuclease SbcCD nuclease subunit